MPAHPYVCGRRRPAAEQSTYRTRTPAYRYAPRVQFESGSDTAEVWSATRTGTATIEGSIYDIIIRVLLVTSLFVTSSRNLWLSVSMVYGAVLWSVIVRLRNVAHHCSL